MSGIVCQILRNAIVTDANSDAQWRALFAQADIAQSVANDTGSADKLCAVLAQPKFSDADKKFFHTMLEGLWQGYS